MNSLVQLYRWFYKHRKRLYFWFFFVGGFIFDNITLRRIDKLYDIVVLASYIGVSAICIIILHIITPEPADPKNKLESDAKNDQKNKTEDSVEFKDHTKSRLWNWTHFILQFSFGGLFSAFMIFYSRSATLIGSWPFLIFIALLFFGNEFLKKRYELLAFRMAIFFTVLFSYTIFTLPLIVHKIGKNIFILSGIVSLIITFILILILSNISHKKLKDSLPAIIYSIFAIYFFYNFAYFSNIIPPVPLSLKNIGLYHHIERLPNGNYKAIGEPVSFISHQLNLTDTFHATSTNAADDTAYIFSSVFAPTVITTPIKHVWFKYDEAKKTWATRNTISFPITGGREDGYRGFSFIQNLEPGLWRVDVMSDDNLLIGQKKFKVVDDSANEKEKGTVTLEISEL